MPPALGPYADMNSAFFFGYGSLVNRQTHLYDPAHPARATGWRRAWRATPDRQVAFLTVIPDPGCAIDGLVAQVPGNDWAALDLREAAYDRLPARHSVTHPAETEAEVAIYAIAPDRLRSPGPDHPVLLSYLDVVLQGYLQVFGTDGADRFMNTTTGWDAPILNDRAAPRYPRAQQLSSAETAYVDGALAALNCRMVA